MSATQPIVVNFADHYSAEAFIRLLRLTQDCPDFHNRTARQAWETKYETEVKVSVEPALKSFFAALKGACLIAPIPHSSGYATHFNQSWNRLASPTIDVDTLTESDWYIITKFFLKQIRRNLDIVPRIEKLNIEDPTPKDLGNLITKMYQDLSAEMTAGTFDWHEFPYPSECYISGKKFLFVFQDWQCQMGDLDFSAGLRNSRFVPAESLERPNKPIHRTIEFKTGNLLIADWFRIPEFTRHSDLTHDKKPNINSVIGREDMADHYLRRGFISVSVGNSCPSILERDGALVFGHDDQQSGKFADRGSVCTDLWNVTIVEEEVLVDIVAKEKPDTAQETVDAYLNGSMVSYRKIKVRPGTYHLYLRGDFENFQRVFVCDALNLDSLTDVKFVLSPVELALKEAPLAIDKMP